MVYINTIPSYRAVYMPQADDLIIPFVMKYINLPIVKIMLRSNPVAS